MRLGCGMRLTALPCLMFCLMLTACGPLQPTPQAVPINPTLTAAPTVSPIPTPPSPTGTAALAVTPTIMRAIFSEFTITPVATRNTYYLGLGPQTSQPCHLLYYADRLKLDPNNCPLRQMLTDRVGVTRYFGLTGEPGGFTVTPDMPAYRQPGFALLACPVAQIDDNICEYTVTDDSGSYRLEIRITGV